MKLIALIDDEPEMEDLFNLVLEDPLKAGLLTLKYFSDPEEFLEWFPTSTPDLVLTDIGLPDLSGIELVSRVNKSGQHPLIYLVSGHSEAAYQKEIRDLGIHRYLSKPLDLDHLSGLIQQDLGILAGRDF